MARSHPLIDEHMNIYFTVVSYGIGGGPGGILKFTSDGSLLWNYTADAQISNGPAIHDGLLMFMTDAGYVGQLDMETGEEVWRVQIGTDGPPDTHSMAAADGYIIAPMRTNALLVIPAPSDPPIYVSPPNGGPETQLVALNMSGHELWRFNTDTMMYNSLVAIVDGVVVVSDTNGRTYCLDLASGGLLWKQEPADYRNFTGMSTGGAVVGPNRVVYVTSNLGVDGFGGIFGESLRGGRLSAYALETGHLLWRRDFELAANNAGAVGVIGPNGNGPLAVVIVIGDNPDFPPQRPGHKRGLALAFDAETGERLAWQHELHWPHAAAAGDTIERQCMPDDASNPAIGADGTVYFGFEDGRVYALRDADGDGRLSTGEVSFFDDGNAYQGSPGIAPGLLVAVPCNGLHVFAASSATSASTSSVATV